MVDSDFILKTITFYTAFLITDVECHVLVLFGLLFFSYIDNIDKTILLIVLTDDTFLMHIPITEELLLLLNTRCLPSFIKYIETEQITKYWH